MKIAIIADIHGNALALDAVLADLKRRAGADMVVNLGDCVSGPLWPRETMEILHRLGAITVRGNHDRQVVTFTPEKMMASDSFAVQEITAEDHTWLGALPQKIMLTPGILACHATPEDDATYLLERIENGGLIRDSEANITNRLGAIGTANIVLIGHSHRPDMLRTKAGITIINPGSVGCPAYDDHDPAHVSQSRTPHARYAIINTSDDAAMPDVQFIALVYDHEKAARRAEENGRNDWAYALRTGYANPA
jgi:predicted phosphodiesterase